MSNPPSKDGLDGIVLIDKAPGWTSHDVVAKARRVVGQKRIGHTGTLDPMASGLLILCLGQATRLVEYLTGHDKRYTGTISLGAATTTDDAEGEVVWTGPVPALSPDDVEKVLQPFRGGILQRPPSFSALKVEGKRAYDVARSGASFALIHRPVTIHDFSASLVTPTTLHIDVTCSSGTYIRSLARDLGEVLGCGGHLSALRRRTAGPFDLREAVTIEGLEAMALSDRLLDIVLPPDDGIADMDAALLCPEAVRIIRNGGWWKSDEPFERGSEALRIYSDSGEFVAMASMAESGEIRPLKVFGRPNSPKQAVM